MFRSNEFGVLQAKRVLKDSDEAENFNRLSLDADNTIH